MLPETACRMRILWPVLTRSKSPDLPEPTPALLIARLLWTEGGKQKQRQQQRIAGNRIAFLSFITRNGKQRNYHLTHSSAMGNAVEEQRGAEKLERQANLSIKNILKFSRFSLLHVDKMAASRRETRRDVLRQLKRIKHRTGGAAERDWQANGAFGKTHGKRCKMRCGKCVKFPSCS